MTLLATLAVLGSGRGRVNGLLYLAGFMIGQAAAFLVVYFVGSNWMPDSKHHRGVVVAAIELGLGVLLLLAARAAHRPQEPGAGSARVSDLLRRLDGLSPSTAFPAGAALGVGTKRFVITALAATTISASTFDASEEAGLAVLYIVLASLLVWLPVGLYLLAGPRADRRVEQTKEWIEADWRPITFWLSLVFGIAILADAIAKLV